jgi:hypothetical protein
MNQEWDGTFESYHLSYVKPMSTQTLKVINRYVLFILWAICVTMSSYDYLNNFDMFKPLI